MSERTPGSGVSERTPGPDVSERTPGSGVRDQTPRLTPRAEAELAARREREAAALRANLRRRKQQRVVTEAEGADNGSDLDQAGLLRRGSLG